MPPEETPAPPTNPPPAPPQPPADTIPKARFNKVVEERDAHAAQVATLQEQLAQATNRLGTLDTVTTELAAAKARAEQTDARFGLFRTASAAGITDPDIFDAVEAHYQGLPPTGRPKLPELLGTWREALSGKEGADPAVVPKLLRPHLAEAWRVPAQTGTKERPPPPPGHGGSPYQPPGGTGVPSADDINAATAALLAGEISREEFHKRTGIRKR